MLEESKAAMGINKEQKGGLKVLEVWMFEEDEEKENVDKLLRGLFAVLLEPQEIALMVGRSFLRARVPLCRG